jgi:hypothetical protein
VLYSPLLKNTITKVRFNDEFLCFEVKSIFALKFDLFDAELAKIRKIKHCQNYSRPLPTRK